MSCTQNPWTPWNDCTDYWFGINQDDIDEVTSIDTGLYGYYAWLNQETIELWNSSGDSLTSSYNYYSNSFSDWFNGLTNSWNGYFGSTQTTSPSITTEQLNNSNGNNSTYYLIALGVLGLLFLRKN